MCHSDASRPPAPPRFGEVVEQSFLTLTASDGNDFAAYFAAPAESPRCGVVILPDVRGLHPYYVALADRFAEAGLAAVAYDFYARTAGVPEGFMRAEDFEWEPHRDASTQAGIDDDSLAAIHYLRSRTSPTLPVITLGFCFGGSQTWRQSAGDLPIAGSVGFYGRPSLVGDAANHASKPVIMIIAGEDFGTPLPDQLALAETMRAAGAEVETYVYEGAPHSFFDRSFADWTEACTDVWDHVLTFTDRLSV